MGYRVCYRADKVGYRAEKVPFRVDWRALFLAPAAREGGREWKQGAIYVLPLGPPHALPPHSTHPIGISERNTWTERLIVGVGHRGALMSPAAGHVQQQPHIEGCEVRDVREIKSARIRTRNFPPLVTVGGVQFELHIGNT